MKISEIILENFRSFGKKEKIRIDDFTVLIGANNVGKTNILLALMRLFGQERRDKMLKKDDFYTPVSDVSGELEEKELTIEVKVEFTNINKVPEFYEYLVISKKDDRPYIRMRLKGKWIRGTSPGGEIEQSLYYVTVPYGEEETNDSLQKVPLHHRSLIQMLYVPAMRNPIKELKNATGTILWRIFKSIEWPKDIDNQLSDESESIRNIFDKNEDIKVLKKSLIEKWESYHNDNVYGDASINFQPSDLESILNNVEVAISPSPDGETVPVDRLGDGLKSLFYFTLVGTLLEVEEKSEAIKGTALLTILAVEEPENHVSPHVLGRTINNLQKTATNNRAQVLVSSHSASILRKIEPEKIRHVQLKFDNSSVKEILLPSKSEDAFKYVKEAVQAYPELYFSRLVILGEGDSEEIVLSKLFSTSQKLCDELSISIVPLGGRHVNHFWKLLNDLSIQHITLLDLDLERGGGGWGRIGEVLSQLDKNGKLNIDNISSDLKEKLERDDCIEDGVVKVDFFKEKYGNKYQDRVERSTATSVKEEIREDLERIREYLNALEEENVFFSYPLDIDFSMYQKFKTSYQNLMSKGPYGKKVEEYSSDEVKKSVASTLKWEKNEDVKINCTSYSAEDQQAMVWYNSLFLISGKPSTHIAALSKIIEKENWYDNFPDELKRLREKVEELLKGSE